jgi:hypothetical protein
VALIAVLVPWYCSMRHPAVLVGASMCARQTKCQWLCAVHDWRCRAWLCAGGQRADYVCGGRCVARVRWACIKGQVMALSYATRELLCLCRAGSCCVGVTCIC